MKKILLIVIACSFMVNAQNLIILMSDNPTVASRDSVPNSYAFTDSTGAAVSTQIISAGVVLAGFDSAGVNVVGGDYKIGALGSITRTATMLSLGDTLFAVDTSSASNSTTTNVAFTIGGVVDTFSTTTVAASGGNPYTTTGLQFYVDADSVADGDLTVWLSEDGVAAFDTIGGYPGGKATKGSGDLVFTSGDLYGNFYDSGSEFFNTWATDMGTGGYSLEAVIMVVDTVTSQVFVGMRENAVSYAMTISVSATGRLCTSNAWVDGFSTIVPNGMLNKKIHVIATCADPSSKPILYVNGVLMTDDGTTNGQNMAESFFMIGAYSRTGNGPVVTGSVINLVRAYNIALSQEQVTANYNSDSVQGKLP